MCWSDLWQIFERREGTRGGKVLRKDITNRIYLPGNQSTTFWHSNLLRNVSAFLPEQKHARLSYPCVNTLSCELFFIVNTLVQENNNLIPRLDFLLILPMLIMTVSVNIRR